VSATELVALVCCDLGSIVRGRSLPASELGARLEVGVGWVPANLSLTPLGPLAEPNPFGSIGDLRLLPDADTHVRVGAEPGQAALEFVICDITETDGRPWECCPRRFLREALAELHEELGFRVMASFEHEFQLLVDSPPGLPFTLEEQRLVEPFPTRVMGALVDAGLEPERFFAEYATHQFEIPVAAVEGIASADRSVLLREIVREVARRQGLRASFAPLFAPGSQAEVPLVGRLGTTVVSGQIDRLAVSADRVLILDYKTNRPPPARVEDVAPAYLRQLATYRALVRRIYPTHIVEAALLWTDGPALMTVPVALLDEHSGNII